MSIPIICRGYRGWLFTLVSLVFTIAPASAQLVFFYDPDTGNVSFDTAETRSGGIHTYGLHLNPQLTSVRFRPENHVRISNSSLFFSEPLKITDVNLSQLVSGYHTIGNVLPTELSEDVWNNLFPANNISGPNLIPRGVRGSSLYVDLIGGGSHNAPAQFVYGMPDREFDNRWDLVDPDSLVWAQQATLIYRPWSGEVMLDTSGIGGGHISAYLLSSEDRFIGEEHTPLVDAPLVTSNSQSVSLFADAIEPGRYSLGRILESGLSATEFQALFSQAKYLGRAGFAGQSFDFDTDGISFALVVQSIPEPTTAVLLSSFVCFGGVFRSRRVQKVRRVN